MLSWFKELNYKWNRLTEFNHGMEQPAWFYVRLGPTDDQGLYRMVWKSRRSLSRHLRVSD